MRSMDVVLPVRETDSMTTRELRLRVVARPDRPVAELLHRLGLELPSAPKLVQNVVEKNSSLNAPFSDESKIPPQLTNLG